MAEKTDALTRLLSRFVNDLMDKLPKIEHSEMKRQMADLEARMARLEAAVERLGAGPLGPKVGRRIKRVTLKDRVVRLVKANPEGIRTSEVARALGVAQTNVSHALRQATEEGLIIKKKRGLYQPQA